MMKSLSNCVNVCQQCLVSLSSSRAHLIGQKICVVQDEVSIFWLVYLEEKDYTFEMHLSDKKINFANV